MEGITICWLWYRYNAGEVLLNKTFLDQWPQEPLTTDSSTRSTHPKKTYQKMMQRVGLKNLRTQAGVQSIGGA